MIVSSDIGARAHDHRNLRNALGGHARLVEEDPAEVFPVGEDVRLERKKGAARIDEVNARQPVLERDLLCADVLLDRDRVVGAALHGRVVGHDDDLAPGDAPDARDKPRGWCVVVVHVVGGEGRQLEEGRARIDELLDSFADRQLALLAMPFQVLRTPALTRARHTVAEVAHKRRHTLGVGLEQGACRVDVGFENVHSKTSQPIMPP
jgi:hypothetical protein